MKILKYLLLTTTALLCIGACKKDSGETPPQPIPEYPITYTSQNEEEAFHLKDCFAAFDTINNTTILYIRSENNLIGFKFYFNSAEGDDYYSDPKTLESLSFSVDNYGQHTRQATINLFGYDSLNYKRRLVDGTVSFKEVTDETLTIHFSGDVKEVDSNSPNNVTGDVIETINDGRIIRLPYTYME